MKRSIVTFGLLAVAFGAQAQDSQGRESRQASVLEELVVTAQKREESLADVGIAVSAFSGEQLDAYGFETSADIIAYSPGVSLAGDIGGQRAIFNIRGVVQNDYADHSEAPVAAYVDGAYIASTQGQTFGLFDVARIELLRGPQGTLFGRNATGGLVNTVTAKPTETFDGYLEATLASFDQRRFEGAFGGPLGDSSRGRLSFLSNNQGEILINDYDGMDARDELGTANAGDGYNDDTSALRAQLEFALGDSGSLLLAYNSADTTKSEGPYQRVHTTRIQNEAGQAIDVIHTADDPLNCRIILQADGGARSCLDGQERPGPGSDWYGNPPEPDGSGRRVNKDFAFDDQNRIESSGFSAQLSYEPAAGMELVLVLDFKNFTRSIGLDSDQTPSAGLIFQSQGEIDQFSHEMRLSGGNDRLQWIGGFYYLSIKTDYLQGLAESGLGETDDFMLKGLEANTILELETASYSLFGQVDWALSEAITLVAGLRLIDEDKGLAGGLFFTGNNDDRRIEPPAAPSLAYQPDNNASFWSGKLQLEFRPDEDSLYYFGVNRGVKAGGFNSVLFSNVFTPYDEEILLAYEGGLKLTLANGLARLNASVFLYDYQDYQVFTFIDNNGTITNEQAEYVGAEVEIFLLPTDNLDIVLGASYTDATIEDLQIAEGIVADRTPAFTPELQVSGLVRYSWPMAGGTLSAQLSASYQSSFYFSVLNFTAHEFDGYVVADANVRWLSADERWQLTAFIDNLTDDDHSVIGFDVSGFYGTSQESYAKPITYGLTFKYHLGR